MIVAAVNDAQRKADEELARTLGPMAGGLKIPGL
jgi:DNA-binding protein YbaB